MYTSIIIPTYNRLQYTKLCIESIRKHTNNTDYELIVVDNHSTDGTIEWLKMQSDVRTIFNNENVGFLKGCNQGIEMAKGANILLLHNDTIVTHDWLKKLRNCLYNKPDTGAVGAITNNCSYYQAIKVNYHSIEEIHKFAIENDIANPDKWEESLNLAGFCLLLKREIIDEIGLLDERFTAGVYADVDYAARMRRAGYQLMLCRNVFVHHFGSTYFQEHPEEYAELLKTNGAKFQEKWGYDPGYSMNVRSELLDLLDQPDELSLRVLEVGCACGGTLLQIKNQYPYAELHGIELNENAAKNGKSFARVIAANIETAVLPYREGYFHYIILADVLEHLQDPWKTLANLYKYLAPNGKILASIPNIMHFSVIKSLLNGSWTYVDSGLLDKTHLRFFTLNEIHKMFHEAGFSKVRYGVCQALCSKQDEEFIAALPLADAAIIDQLKAYQYLIRAEK